jgi:glycosyltransferase involved in cell wall biosynthesis
MTNILSVATAGVYAEQLADVKHLRFPRVDYIELQRLLNIDTLDYSAYDNSFIGHLFRRLETELRSDVYMASLSWWKSRGYPVLFAWSERAGIPLAAFKRLARADYRFVTMFQCWSERQEFVITKLNLFSIMDEIIVHCTSMRENFIQLGVPEERVKIIHYSIDQSFFSPIGQEEQQNNMIMSIGEPRSRHYPLLFKAVDGLPLTLKVAGYGQWYAREKYGSLQGQLPANVSMTKHLSQSELRKLYAGSQFVVLPVRDLVYSAGATAALEAGSMARAVIAFRSKGITDYVIDGETGILVEPGNVEALREAIRYLLANPREARRLGDNARQRILQELNLETYVGQIAELLSEKEEEEKRSIARVGLPAL